MEGVLTWDGDFTKLQCVFVHGFPDYGVLVRSWPTTSRLCAEGDLARRSRESWKFLISDGIDDGAKRKMLQEWFPVQRMSPEVYIQSFRAYLNWELRADDFAFADADLKAWFSRLEELKGKLRD